MSDETGKAVAVVVPVYNRLELLRDTIESLRAQTLDSAEFLLVDDRSDGVTAEYLDSLPAADSRFRVLRKPGGIPRGCQSSRNIGLDAARATSIVFLDSDDLLAPRCLEERYAVLEASRGVDIVVGRQAIFSGGAIRWVNLACPGVSELDRFLNMAGRIDVPWVNGGVLIRTAALHESGIRWREEFHWDDVAFHFECLVAGMRASTMGVGGAPDSCYRRQEGEGYGSILFTAAGIRNAAAMFRWMSGALNSSGKLTAARSHALARSFFHFCVVQPLDNGIPALAGELILEAEKHRLVGHADGARMRAYRASRLTRRVSSRASEFAERFARRTWMRDFFAGSASTFCVERAIQGEDMSLFSGGSDT